MNEREVRFNRYKRKVRLRYLYLVLIFDFILQISASFLNSVFQNALHYFHLVVCVHVILLAIPLVRGFRLMHLKRSLIEKGRDVPGDLEEIVNKHGAVIEKIRPDIIKRDSVGKILMALGGLIFISARIYPSVNGNLSQSNYDMVDDFFIAMIIYGSCVGKSVLNPVIKKEDI